MNARGEASGDSDVRPSQMASSVRSVSKMTNPIGCGPNGGGSSRRHHRRRAPRPVSTNAIRLLAPGRTGFSVGTTGGSSSFASFRMRSIYKAERPSGSSKSLPWDKRATKMALQSLQWR